MLRAMTADRDMARGMACEAKQKELAKSESTQVAMSKLTKENEDLHTHGGMGQGHEEEDHPRHDIPLN